MYVIPNYVFVCCHSNSHVAVRDVTTKATYKRQFTLAYDSGWLESRTMGQHSCGSRKLPDHILHPHTGTRE